MHHRSAFDTIPCPSIESLIAQGRMGDDFTGKGDNGEPVRVSANGRAAFPIDEEYTTRIGAPVSEPEFSEPGYITTLRFEGGDAEIRKPTREELLTSARQWVTRAREDMNDLGYVQESVFDRLDAVLAELAAL